MGAERRGGGEAESRQLRKGSPREKRQRPPGWRH